MSISYQKVQSVGKVMMARSAKLDQKVLDTLKTCASLVGSTLGPGGMNVVIERQEAGMPPVITKDGVTVFKALGFEDPASQVILEAARHASVRTASEAGDGTTSSSILSESLVRHSQHLVGAHPELAPQKIARTMTKLFRDELAVEIKRCAMPCDLVSEEGRSRLLDVARISANGDVDLAKAVMECFDIVGDEGNVTIVEDSGPSSYRVDKIDGYPIPIGYEDCAGIWFQEFINDAATQQAVLEEPMFLLYHGRINDFNDLYPVLGMVASAIDPAMNVKPNLVIVATGFADNVLANLAATFKAPGMLHVFPLTAPKSMNRTGQYDFMLDVAALTGTKIFDPLNDPLQNITSIDQLGKGPRAFTSSRYRSAVLGHRDELLVLERVDELTKQLESGAASEYEKTFLKERVAKLTSGIARLIVTGPSNGETKERRDRAEDAVCAVRGAIKFGALPGGGAVLLHLSRGLRELRSRVSYANQPETLLVAESVMAPALEEPCIRLFTNAGYTEDEARKFFPDITVDGMVFDIAKHEWVKAGTGGLYDATPAVSSALENALSVAGTLGACGGIVTFQRDKELERTEARSSAEFMRNANTNEANERG